ncbi:cysteine desulfurase [Candidatus Saccharibacteria bacterium]|nr:cysteine desulfurase [Candidatus Saccharibacteria bacterium]
MIYLDGAATSKLLPSVKTAMLAAMDADLGNASSLHSAGQRAKNLIEDARQKVADLINADPAEILFTSGGSESNNTVIHTFAEKTIATSAVEHPSVLEPTKKYAKSHLLLPVDEQGIVSPKNLPPADLYSVMFANNELGTIEPIKQLAAKKPKNSFFHSDLTQAVGKTKLDVKTLGLDYATFSAHKIGGPVGIGALFVKKGSPLTPLILGGHQEHGLRAGTYPTVQIAGFGAAADFITKTHPWKIYKERVSLFRNYLASRILKEIPFSSLNTPLDHSLANILNVSFAAAEGESIQLYLDLKGNIIVSTGSACASGDGKPSHVIMATKNDAEIAHSSIRFSLDLETTKEDIDKIMDLLPDIIKNLQSISTIKPKEQK